MRILSAAAAVALLLGGGLSATHAADTPFDGVYVGTVTNTKDASTCGDKHSWGGKFEVAGGKLSGMVAKIPVNSEVKADGSFEATSLMGRTYRMETVGKIAGGTLHATSTTALCQWDLAMKKRTS